MANTKWRERRRRAALMLFGLIFGLVVAEVVLRIIGYSYPEFYVTDTSRGYALRPNTSGWYRKENQVYVEINSDGLRDREHTKTKPANTFRIAIVGDSYAEALQVPLETAFWQILQTRLTSCDGNQKQIEVINFGVSGYGTAQELITLREHVWDYSPDIVLLAVTTNNDITDNLRELKKAKDIPYFVLKNDQLMRDDSFRSTAEFEWRESATGRFGRWFRDHFRVVQAIMEGHRAARLRLAALRAKKSSNEVQNEKPSDTQAPVRSEELGTDNLVYREPGDATWKDAWQVTEKLIDTMHREVEAHQAKFLVVTLSNGIQVTPSAQVREDFLKHVGATDLFYPDHRITELGSRDGFAVINLAPDLLTYAERNNVFLHGFGSDLGSGHWNEKGHQIAGEILSQKMCEGGWLK
ncbi:MAG TPA: SGNH/GDSL hydrolase family protein [Pyrinomonadaceae bacterium]